MKNKALIILTVITMVIALMMTGCIRIVPNSETIYGSGDTITREYDYENFTRVEVGYAFEVDITRSDDYGVSIQMNENLFDYLDVSKSGSTLRVRMKPNFNFQRTTRQVTIVMPEIRALKLSGASRGEITGFESTDTMDFEVSGASSLELTDLISGDARFDISGASRVIGDIVMIDGDFDISGASTVEIEGNAEDVDMEVSGASTARMENFPMETARVDVSGASNATVDVSDQLDVDVSGASKLTYGGDAELSSVQVSGGSTLNRR